MPFSIHVNKATKRAIAHAPACPEAPAEPVRHGDNDWMFFPTQEETDVVRRTLVDQGFDAPWCECAECQLTRDLDSIQKASPDW